MGFRPTAELRKKIEKVAATSGLSLTSEVERRLEQSFLKENADDRVRQAIVRGIHESFGGEPQLRMAYLFAQCGSAAEAKTGKPWTDDWTTFKVAVGVLEGIAETLLGKEPVSQFEEAIGRRPSEDEESRAARFSGRKLYETDEDLKAAAANMVAEKRADSPEKK